MPGRSLSPAGGGLIGGRDAAKSEEVVQTVRHGEGWAVFRRTAQERAIQETGLL